AQLALGEVEVAVQRAGVDDGYPPDEVVPEVEEVGAETDLDVCVVGHPLEPCGVAVDRQSLERVAEVPVVEGVPHREPGDDLSGQFQRVGLRSEERRVGKARRGLYVASL